MDSTRYGDTGMKVRIRGVEIHVESLDELDDLIERYGSTIAADDGEVNSTPSRRNSSPKLDTRDRVVLERLVQAGSTGVPSTELGKILGKMGRGTRGAARRWASRIGLVQHDNVDPFEECRVGTKRGLRIESAHLAVAKGLL